MIEISSQLAAVREFDLRRVILERFELALGQASSSKSVMELHNCIVPISFSRGKTTDSCGLYLLPNHAEDLPVTYRGSEDWWEINANPSYLELRSDQQKIALAYAASRAYTEAPVVSLNISSQLGAGILEDIESFVKSIATLDQEGKSYILSLRI